LKCYSKGINYKILIKSVKIMGKEQSSNKEAKKPKKDSKTKKEEKDQKAKKNENRYD
jgi:hypothetical protein